MAEKLIPAADLSEQISTAGKEASGTGNMKFSLNGALTIGTLDGANVEIREHVCAENFFKFGLSVDEANERRSQHQHAQHAIKASSRLQRVLNQITDGVFSNGDRDRYRSLIKDLSEQDNYLVTSDFDTYFNTQREVDAVYSDPSHWMTMASINTARMGWFSSDRTVQSYADDIWSVQSLLDAQKT